MKISLQWLGEWVDTGKDVRGLAHALTMVGLEVEAIQPAAPPLANVVVGEVKADGQFNVVWKTKGPVRAQPWSQYIAGNDKKKDEPEKK